jgi:hypothetical protein
MATFKIVAGNTAPDYTITCTRDGDAINLAAATDVSLIIQQKSTGSITQSGRSAVITTPASGVITYTALSTDFPEAGTYIADIKATYSGGGVEIFFNQAKFKVRDPISA